MSEELAREDAQQSLAQVEEVAKRTRTMLAYRGGDTLFVLWGIIWVVGFTVSQFIPPASLWAWGTLVPVGVLVTLLVSRQPVPVKSPDTRRLTRRIGLMWVLLFLYVDLWVALLWPFLQPSWPAFSRHFCAVATTVPMFAYVVMGLWLDNCMVWLGLGITALTVIGLVLVPAWFFLWMAVMGGGTLIATGLIIRRRWR